MFYKNPKIQDAWQLLAGVRSEMIVSILRHMTSSFHVMDIKGSIFGRAMNHPSFIP